VPILNMTAFPRKS